MLKNIITILFIAQLALPYVHGSQIKLNPPSHPPTDNPRPSCASITCPPGKHCKLEPVPCVCCGPCFPVPTCINNSMPDPRHRPSCASTTCLEGNHCELQQVTCLCCAPCFPEPTCIDNSIPGCSIVECPAMKICVLKMGTTQGTCIDEIPDSP